jgi:hypothetical protein
MPWKECHVMDERHEHEPASRRHHEVYLGTGDTGRSLGVTPFERSRHLSQL